MFGQIVLLGIGVLVLVFVLMTPQILYKLEKWAEKEHESKKRS